MKPHDSVDQINNAKRNPTAAALGALETTMTSAHHAEFETHVKRNKPTYGPTADDSYSYNLRASASRPEKSRIRLLVHNFLDRTIVNHKQKVINLNLTLPRFGPVCGPHSC